MTIEYKKRGKRARNVCNLRPQGLLVTLMVGKSYATGESGLLKLAEGDESAAADALIASLVSKFETPIRGKKALIAGGGG